MQIIFQTKEKTLIVKLIGELDHHVAGGVKERIDKKITSGAIKNLIFDFSALSFMDSSGIGFVMGRYRQAHEKGGRAFIVGANDYVDKIFEMSGIYQIIQKCETVEEACTLIKGER